jgi:hypothetical protein
MCAVKGVTYNALKAAQLVVHKLLMLGLPEKRRHQIWQQDGAAAVASCCWQLLLPLRDMSNANGKEMAAKAQLL